DKHVPEGPPALVCIQNGHFPRSPGKAKTEGGRAGRADTVVWVVVVIVSHHAVVGNAWQVDDNIAGCGFEEPVVGVIKWFEVISGERQVIEPSGSAREDSAAGVVVASNPISGACVHDPTPSVGGGSGCGTIQPDVRGDGTWRGICGFGGYNSHDDRGNDRH